MKTTGFLVYSLRTKLLLLSVALATVPGVIFGLIALANTRGALEKAVGRLLTDVAHDAARTVAATLSEERQKLRGLAHQDLMREVIIGDLDKRISRLLLSVKNDDPAYLDLMCADVTGRVIAATDPSALGTLHAQRHWFRKAMEEKKVLSRTVVSDAYGRRVTELAMPISNPDQRARVIGTLYAVYDWDRSMRPVARMRQALAGLGLDVDLLVLDGDGKVIGGSGGPEVQHWLGRDLGGAGGQSSQQPSVLRRQVGAERPVAALVGRAHLERLQPRWSVLALQPLAEALAPVRHMQKQLLSVLGAVLITAVALAMWFERRMTYPLRELTRATEEFGRSGAARSVSVRSRDEIGRLARAFNEMGSALERAQDDLVSAAKFAFVGEVAAGIAHEVRTPLSILRSSAQLLRRSPGVPSKSNELVDMIVGEVDRIDRVVAGLLEMARPSKPVVEAACLEPILSRALDFVAAQAQERHVALRRAFGASETVALCDAEEIYRVALNLVVNALQILPEGGEVCVRTLACDNARVAFEVSDNGPGIPADLRQRIFTPFFTQREGGTGLGLVLVQRVVQAHHGSVTVESEVGHGSTFRVELPAPER